jgi:hypothetical protein
MRITLAVRFDESSIHHYGLANNQSALQQLIDQAVDLALFRGN